MLGKPVSGKRNPSGGDAGNTRFLHEIEALSKALSLDSKNRRRSLPPPTSDHRSLSAGRPHPSDPKPKAKPNPSSQKEKKPSSSFWSWKPLKALSHIGHRRFDCRFSLHVHSVEGLPPALADAALAVHWKRTTDPAAAAAATRPTRALHGTAAFDETLTYRCSVYGSRSGAHNSAKYDARHFVIWATVDGAPGFDLGKHLVDLSRLLPLTLDELEEEEKSTGRWSTTFRLSGKAKGASLNVSFGFSLVGDGPVGSSGGGDKKVSEILSAKAGRMDRVSREDSVGKGGSMVRACDRSRSVEDVKVLHEVLPSSTSDLSGLANVGRDSEYQKYGDGEFGTLEVDSKVELEVSPQMDESPDLKPCTLSDPVKGIGEKDCDEPEFMVIEQGIEVASNDQVRDSRSEKIDLDEVDKGAATGHNELGVEPDEQVDEFSSINEGHGESSVLPGDPVMEDVDFALTDLSILQSEELESPQTETKTCKPLSYAELKSNHRTGSMKSRSLSLDDASESVASEFLSMLGIEHSPFGLSSDSDPESPRERLWKQFEKESLNTSDGLFGPIIGVEKEPNWGDFSEDLDLSSIVLEAETELQKATRGMNSKSRAKMLEDAETEALMREWGLNEKVFQRSPPGSRSGFGSPIDIPLEEPPLELPPLGEGLGPFLQTKDGGFVRSMSPSLFSNAKNNGNLVMQVSSPVVVPAEMGSGIMEILQGLASVGIEKLSMQAKKLMPLEDISGKTMQQIAWEATPALEACERKDLLRHSNPEVDSGIGQYALGRKKKGKGLNLASSSGGEMSSEYISLEDLAPLAMDKIEALSIEGLKIQSGMSDEEAPSNISPQSIGDISALEGKEAKNSRSLGLDGAAGLQLLDIKDSGDDVDGLMGLSITLDEWMRLDSGIVDEEDQISDRTSKILAAHHACSKDFISGGSKGDKRGGKRSGRRWGLLGNNFTVALMVQLRDPLRDYEPVGTPMLSLIQVERVFVPPKPKIYRTVSERGNSEQDDEIETKVEPVAKEEKKEEEEVIPQFKITEVHVAGLKTEPGKKKLWGNPTQQQSGSRWLLATGMGKSNKHPFMKSKAAAKPSQATTTVQPGDTLWSISSRIHGNGAKWKELAALNPHIRNPNVIFPNETIRLC